MKHVALDSLEFWQFSLSFYSVKDVQTLLLNLQDNYGLNVNVLLFCMYCDTKDIELNELVLTNVLSATKEKDAELIRFRTKRKQAKGAKANGSEPNIRYQRYLAQELEMEKAQQEQIVGTYLKESEMVFAKHFSAKNLSTKNLSTKNKNEQTRCFATSSNMQIYIHLHLTGNGTGRTESSKYGAEAQVMIEKLQDLREKHTHV